MGGSVQICNQTEPQPAELNQLVLNQALREYGYPWEISAYSPGTLVTENIRKALNSINKI